MELCVYHRFRETKRDGILYPLSQLKEKHPDLWVSHVRKYYDRPWLSERKIELLGCGWHDVIFFSPVSPLKIMEALRSAGLNPDPMQFIKIPAWMLSRERTVIMTKPSRTGEVEYVAYDPTALSDHADISDVTLCYYRQCAEFRQRPLLFHGIAHVLYRGSLNVTGLPTVEGR